MAQREYTTASGKKIDFDTMQLKGEETIAVGNMSVNARGDRLGPGGDVVQTREEVMADYYRIHNGTIPEDKPIGANRDEPVDDLITADAVPPAVPPTLEADTNTNEENINSEKLAEALASAAVEVKEEPALRSVAAEVLAPDEQVESTSKMSVPTPKPPVEEVEEPVKEEKPRGGLASAVAKVKTTKPVVKEKTKAQEEKAKGGVKRL